MYILLAVFLGIFGRNISIQAKRKKASCPCVSFDYCTFFVGLYCALVALFLKADTNGNIKIIDKEKIKTDQLAGASEAMKQIEKYSIPLMTTSDLEIYSDSLKHTLDNLSKLAPLCEAFPKIRKLGLCWIRWRDV